MQMQKERKNHLDHDSGRHSLKRFLDSTQLNSTRLLNAHEKPPTRSIVLFSTLFLEITLLF